MPLTKPQRRRLVPYMRTDERANTFGTLNFAVLSAVRAQTAITLWTPLWCLQTGATR